MFLLACIGNITGRQLFARHWSPNGSEFWHSNYQPDVGWDYTNQRHSGNYNSSIKKKKVIIQFIHSLFSFAWRPALNKNTEAFNEE